MRTEYANPYRDARGTWIRGNLHGHCAEHSGCASVPLAQGVDLYRSVGAQFMAVTDHDVVTDLSAVEAANPDMVFFEGFEYTRAENVLFIGESVPPLYKEPLVKAVRRASGLITVVCHPDPNPDTPYWTVPKVLELGPSLTAVEVYNGHYGVPRMRAAGRRPHFTHFWDELLTAGSRAWGMASDDFHDLVDFDNAFNMVRVEHVTKAAILDAVRRGHFYGSTGLLLDRVDEDGDRFVVSLAEPARGRFIGPHGQVLASAEGTTFEYTPRSEPYVRFEATSGAGTLYLQPWFLAVT